MRLPDANGLNKVTLALFQGVPFDQAKFNQDVFTTVEQVFTFDRSIYPSKPIGKVNLCLSY